MTASPLPATLDCRSHTKLLHFVRDANGQALSYRAPSIRRS
jgi:hypothetical protein